MTAPISPTSSTLPTGATSSSSGAASAPLGQIALNENDFLQMLVAQMKNQDPMNPMQGTEFATQLAQFSSVEQLLHLNDKMDAQTTAVQNASATSMASSMVGHNVLVPGNTIDVADGATPQVTMDLPADAANVSVTILDGDGKKVATQSFASAAAGRQTFTLDGTSLAAGTYSYTVNALDANGAPVSPTTYSTAYVQGASLTSGNIYIRVDGTLLPISSVVEVLAPATAPAKNGNTDPTTSSTTNSTTTTQGATTS